MKARLLAVLLISTLVLASAAPVAFAQAERDPSVQYVDCSQVQGAFASQYGNANAIGDGNTAEVAQELNISQNQVNACLGNLGEEGDEKPPVDDSGKDPDDENTTESEEETQTDGQAAVLAGTVPKVDELPNTGGPSLLTVALGVALIVGGASLIRFRR